MMMWCPSYYDDYKDKEQQLMVLMDRYYEVARALGFEGDEFWGDVHAHHDQIIDRAKTYHAQSSRVRPEEIKMDPGG